MPDIKISQLPVATTPLTGTEELPLVQGGVTSKATAQDIADLGGGGGLAIPTFTITPSWPSWAAIIYNDPNSLKINSVTTQVSTYSLDLGGFSVFGSYYGASGSNYITAFSTDAQAISSSFLGGILQNVDVTLTSINLPTVKVVAGQGFDTYGSLFLPNSANLTSISLPNLVACQTIEFLAPAGNLTTLDLSSLSYIRGAFNAIYSSNSGLVVPTLSFSSLVTIDTGKIDMFESSPGITSVLFNNLKLFGGNIINLNLPSSVTTLNFNSLEVAPNITTFTLTMPGLASFGLPALKRITSFGYVQFDFNGCILDQTSVDNILVTLAALDGTAGTTNWTIGGINIAGGCAAPSGTGTAAAAVLVGRGISVTTN